MSEGIVQLVFLALIVLASVLDATGRRKKRQQRMDEMEAEEAAQEGDVAVATKAERAEPVRDAPADTDERETADSMIPSDLWAILTGQTPADRPGPPRDSPRPEPEPSWEPAPTPVPHPPPEPTYEAWGGEEVDDLNRRPKRSPPAPASARAASVGRGGRPATHAPITATAVSDRSGSDAPRYPAPARPGQAAGYAALVRAGGTNSLRTAVVVKEILDRPRGLMSPDEFAHGGRRSL